MNVDAIKEMMKYSLVLYRKSVLIVKSLVLMALMLLALCIGACSRVNDGKEHRPGVINALMDSAELVMNDNPGLAFCYMDSIDSRSIRDKERLARYALLYSEVQYKNYVDVASDSLIMIAVRYYSISKNLLNRFRSYYSLGCIYYELGLRSDAALALAEAERLTDRINDDFRVGLLYTQLGRLYLESFMFSRAETYYDKAAQYYGLAGKEMHRMYALSDVARCKLELDEFAEANTVFKEVMDWSVANMDEELHIDCLQNILACALYSEDADEAKVTIEALQTRYGVRQDNAHMFLLLAQYYILLKDYNKAESFVEKARKCTPNVNDSIVILHIDSQIFQNKGDFKAALECTEQASFIQNEMLRPMLQQSVMGTQKDYYHNVSELEAVKASRRASAVIVVILVSALLIGTFVLYHLYNKQKLQIQIADSLAIIRDLTEKDKTNTQKITQLDSELKNLFSNQYASLDKLYQDMTRYQDVKRVDNATTFLKKVNAYFNEITSKGNQKKLDKIINETYNDLMIRLSDPTLGIADGDLTIIRLLLIGYSVKTIGGLTKESVDNVYQKRHRLIRKIEGISEPLAAELRQALKMN